MLKNFRKMIKTLMRKSKDNKLIKSKQKTYNVNDFFVINNVEFIDIDFNNEKNMKKIVILFKKLINIVFKFD